MTEPFATHKDRVVIPPQGEKFIEAARALGCDDHPEHFRERLGKLVKHKAVEKPDRASG